MYAHIIQKLQASSYFGQKWGKGGPMLDTRGWALTRGFDVGREALTSSCDIYREALMRALHPICTIGDPACMIEFVMITWKI